MIIFTTLYFKLRIMLFRYLVNMLVWIYDWTYSKISVRLKSPFMYSQGLLLLTLPVVLLVVWKTQVVPLRKSNSGSYCILSSSILQSKHCLYNPALSPALVVCTPDFSRLWCQYVHLQVMCFVLVVAARIYDRLKFHSVVWCLFSNNIFKISKPTSLWTSDLVQGLFFASDVPGTWAYYLLLIVLVTFNLHHIDVIAIVIVFFCF